MELPVGMSLRSTLPLLLHTLEMILVRVMVLTICLLAYDVPAYKNLANTSEMEAATDPT